MVSNAFAVRQGSFVEKVLALGPEQLRFERFVRFGAVFR